MQVSKRKISINTLSKTPYYIWYFVKCFFLFKAPLSVIYYYVTKTSPKSKLIELRNGCKIFLSDNSEDIAEDIVTIFIVIAKGEYGKVSKNSLVLDIGANIGVFSLYAAYMGAKKVYSYEPNGKAYECLLHNISENNFLDVIIPHRLAVTSTEGDTVKFPIKSSPQNQIIKDDSVKNFELVYTTNLENILKINSISCVDLLKLDCQGTEYEVFFNAKNSVFSKIVSIKMEYHNGLAEELISFLKEHNFELFYKRQESSIMGNLWFSKSREV